MLLMDEAEKEDFIQGARIRNEGDATGKAFYERLIERIRPYDQEKEGQRAGDQLPDVKYSTVVFENELPYAAADMFELVSTTRLMKEVANTLDEIAVLQASAEVEEKGIPGYGNSGWVN